MSIMNSYEKAPGFSYVLYWNPETFKTNPKPDQAQSPVSQTAARISLNRNKAISQVDLTQRFIEDDFDLEQYKLNFTRERIIRTQKKNKHVRDKVILRISNFLIMLTMLALGSLFYSFLTGLIQNLT